MHFTYREPDQTVLRQGDVLVPTPDLIGLLRQYDPHYAQGHYTHYQVLTQSWDLVLGRRQQYCKARYITLAAIRNIDVAINRELDDRAKELIEFQGTRFASSEAQYSMRSFMDRLLNNNEPSYFFLRACPERGIAEDSCTFLRLSIAIKSDDHYQLCASAKTLVLLCYLLLTD